MQLFLHLSKFNILQNNCESASKAENYTETKEQTSCRALEYFQMYFLWKEGYKEKVKYLQALETMTSWS